MVGLAAGVWLFPWNTWLADKIKSELSARGFPPIEFSIDHVGTQGITFKNITFDQFTLDSLTLGYVPQELVKGNIRGIQTGAIAIKQGKMDITLGSVSLDLEPNKDGVWQGSWKIIPITVSNAPIELPPLNAEGTVQLKPDAISGGGKIRDKSGQYASDFALNYRLKNNKGGTLTIASLQMPWNDGIVRTRGVSVPIPINKPVTFKVELQKVAVNNLLQEATGGRAGGTGEVMGSVPVTIYPDGSFTIQAGMLNAKEAGTIVMSPDAIPGDNAQVALVRDVMQNFHYTTLALKLDSDKDKKLSMLLSLTGNNPDVYNGREVKLNVRLTGDLLDLLQQSVMTLNDPKRLIEQGEHDKK